MLTRIRIVTACLLFPFVLSSCGLFGALVIGRLLDDCHPQGVPFSKVALSGTFEGWVDDYPAKEERTPLRFELESSYIDKNEYSVSGTLSAGGRDAAELAGAGDGELHLQLPAPGRGRAPKASPARAGTVGGRRTPG